MMINAIEKAGLAYRVMFTSIDHHARVLAAANGIGLMPFPRRFVGEPLMIASEYYLPELRYVRVGLFVRSGSDDAKITALVGKLRALSPSEARVSAAERESPNCVSKDICVSKDPLIFIGSSNFYRVINFLEHKKLQRFSVLSKNPFTTCQSHFVRFATCRVADI